MLAGLEFPVLCGSAETGVGVDRLLDYLCELGPSPADRPVTVVAGDTTVEVPADASAAPLVQVFKTVSDPFVGQLSYFKVVSGTVRTDDHLVNSRTGVEERLHGLFTVLGKLQQPVTELVAGEIGAVAKLSDSQAGDTLAAKGSPVRVPVPPAPNPVRGRRSAGDPERRRQAERSAATPRAEDPALRVEHRALPPARPSCSAPARPTYRWRWSAWHASSAHASRPRTIRVAYLQKRSPAPPSPKAR
ncbi:MAG: EF-Tu/IF-2/RF-3 family GTPase [Ilumatobacteraceae bacterium]